MAARFEHAPVMPSAVVGLIAQATSTTRLVVDCTVGGAGHAVALLAALPEWRLLGLDRDPEAVEAARARLEPYGERARVVHARFSEVAAVLRELGEPPAGALLADLGVSSHQLDS